MNTARMMQYKRRLERYKAQYPVAYLQLTLWRKYQKGLRAKT